jgi:flagellar assembly protein FliH
MSCKIFESLPEDENSVPWMRGTTPARVEQRKVVGNPAPPAAEAEGLRAQLQELTIQAEKQTKAAFEEGLRQGDAGAKQSLEAEFRASTERLGAAIVEITHSRAETLRRAESDTVRLAIAIARRVLHRELSVDPSALEGLIKSALQKLKDQEILRVRVHAPLAKLLSECIARTGRGETIEIISDPARPPGGVIFEIARGALDASLETQLREIERGLVDELRTRT